MSALSTTASRRIRISEPDLGPDVEALVLQVLRSGRLAQGPMVERFEVLCAAMAGTAHAVAVNTGTAALEAALRVAGVGPGDEVITTPFTFAATLNAILGRGAIVRFADVGDDLTIDPARVEPLIGPRTRAVVPVHLYGLMADMDAIAELARARGIAIVEDAAQAHGASRGGRRAGAAGLGCFSFYATKNVTSGEGGCVTTDDDAAAAALRILRNQGMRRRYEYVDIGQNWRMTEVAAAIAIPQMERLEERTAARRRNAAALSALLGDDERLTLPAEPPGCVHSWHQYTVLLAPGVDRDRVASHLDAAGIECGVYYPRLVWDYAAYRTEQRVIVDRAPVAESAARRCLSLPVHPLLDAADLVRIAMTLLRALEI